MGKTTHDFALLDGCWCLALFGQGNDFREIFASVGIGLNMLPARETRRVGGKHAVFIRGFRCGRHNAVGGKHDGTVEGLELFFLLPPCVAIVTHEVFVFFELWIIVCGQHFAVGINIHSRTFCLLKQLLNVLQVVATD